MSRQIVDLGCFPKEASTRVVLETSSVPANEEVVYRWRVFDPDLKQDQRLAYEVSGNALATAEEIKTRRRAVDFRFLVDEGVAYIEVDRASLRWKEDASQALGPNTIKFFPQESEASEEWFKLEVYPLKGSTEETVAFDFGNKATACASYTRPAPNEVVPATKHLNMGGIPSPVLDSTLYALAFCDPKVQRYADDAVSFITEDQKAKLLQTEYKVKDKNNNNNITAEYVGVLDAQANTPCGWGVQKGAAGTQPFVLSENHNAKEPKTKNKAFLSQPVDGFKAMLGTADAETSEQTVNFFIQGDTASIELRYAQERTQNLITAFLTRLVLSAAPLSRYLYTLPSIKQIVKEHGASQELAQRLKEAARLVSPVIAPDDGSGSDDEPGLREEGKAALACTTWQELTTQAEPCNEVYFVCIEMGAGHTHTMSALIDRKKNKIQPIRDRCGSLSIGGEFVTLAPFYHLLKKNKLEKNGGDLDDNPDEYQALMDVIYHNLEDMKLDKGELEDWVRRQFKEESLLDPQEEEEEKNAQQKFRRRYVRRGVMQLLRSLFFQGIPTHDGLGKYIDKWKEEAGSNDELIKALTLGYRHWLSRQGDMQHDAERGQESFDSRYMRLVNQYFCIDTFPREVRKKSGYDRPDWQEKLTHDDADGGDYFSIMDDCVKDYANLLERRREDGQGDQDNTDEAWKSMPRFRACFSGRAALEESLRGNAEAIRLNLVKKIRDEMGRDTNGVALEKDPLNALVEVNPPKDKSGEESKMSVAKGAIYLWHDEIGEQSDREHQNKSEGTFTEIHAEDID